jgi:ketosteroid isomerase-like protein
MATVTERDTIVQTVLDYYEGWFDGDVERMDSALHPDLVKRRADESLGITTKERMLELTAQGEGSEDAADRRIDVEVEDVHRAIANVTVQTAVYHEYIQLVRTTDGWKIANVLWEPT